MMEKAKKAAIDIDQVRSKTIQEVSAADFLAALEEADVSVQQLVGLPEKKKVELWVEPEDPPSLTTGDLIDWIRAEKKKVELEVPPDFEDWQKVRETRYNELVTRVAKDVEAKLREQQ
jgi:hypothetical protein